MSTSAREPLYAYLADQLRSKISCGAWGDGEQIPTEEQLCQEFNMSRTTVRRALDLLVNEKLLEKKRPKGTFVRSAEERDHILKTYHRGFTEKLIEQGGDPKTLRAKVVLTHPSLEIATNLGIEPTDDVIFLQRLRGDGQKAFVLFETYLTYWDELPLTSHDYYGSLYVLLGEKGIRMKPCYEEFEAVLPDDRIQNILGVKSDTAILKRVIGASSLDGAFREYTICHYIGNEYLYRYEYA